MKKPRATSKTTKEKTDETNTNTNLADITRTAATNVEDLSRSNSDSHCHQHQEHYSNESHHHHHHHHQHHQHHQHHNQPPSHHQFQHQHKSTTTKKKSTSIFNKKPYLSKKISTKTPLESIKENVGGGGGSISASSAASSRMSFNQTVGAASSGSASSTTSNNGCFGIRSYLHEFYEHSSGGEAASTELDYLIRQRRKYKRMRFLWLVTTWLSVIGLVLGASLLLVGYLSEQKTPTPSYSSSSSHSKSIENAKEEATATEFNYFLECSRVFGLILFSVSGFLLAMCLIMPSFLCQNQCFTFSHSSIDDDLPSQSINLTHGTGLTSSSNLFKSGNMNYQVVEPQSFKLN